MGEFCIVREEGNRTEVTTYNPKTGVQEVLVFFDWNEDERFSYKESLESLLVLMDTGS